MAFFEDTTNQLYITLIGSDQVCRINFGRNNTFTYGRACVYNYDVALYFITCCAAKRLEIFSRPHDIGKGDAATVFGLTRHCVPNRVALLLFILFYFFRPNQKLTEIHYTRRICARFTLHGVSSTDTATRAYRCMMYVYRQGKYYIADTVQ